MRKLFLKFSMLFLVLTMGVSASWGQEETPDGQTVYLVAFKTQAWPESTGSGIVKLTWIDAQGKLFDNALLTFLNDPNVPDQYRMPYATGNPSNGNAFSEDAMVVGATLFATESLEESNPESLANQVIRNMFVKMKVDTSHVFVTPFAYYKADAQGANGSYFDRWTFNDAKVTRQDTAMDKTSPQSAYFKVLPNSKNVFYMVPPSTTTYLSEAYMGAVSAPNMVYAVFNKYLLANPSTTSAMVDAEDNNQANLTVTVEVDGDAASLDAADFGSFTFTNNGSSEWSYDLSAALASKEVVSAQKTKITIPVTYTYKNTGFGTKSTKMTIRMAGDAPSELNVDLAAEALDPGRAEAYWFDGKTEKTSGDLADMLNENISTYANPILKLNKPVSTNLTFAGKDFTLDLNGNVAQAITVSSGNVTVAYSDFGGEAASLTVNGGKAILNGGTFGALTIGAGGEVEQNGATVSGATINNGTLTTNEGVFNGGLTSSKTLTINNGTFKGETAVLVSGGTAAINRGAIEGKACGLKVTAGKATVKKLAAIKGSTYSAQQTGTGKLIVECGKFDGPLNGTIDFTSGYFKTNTYGVSTEGKNEMLVSVGKEYDEGYRYFLGTAESAVANGAGVCRIGNVSYAKLEDAIKFANNNPAVENIVIFMTNNYTLPAGYYTLPANATIVVPMSDSQEKELNLTAPRIIFNDQRTETPYVSIQPEEFRRLTFASGVNMDVFGKIELTCSQYASNEAYTSQPVGPYGRLVLEEGSHLTLMDKSEFRAWGFVTGKGEMDARRGATVREMFQMGDWKGAMTSVEITGMAPEMVADHSDKKIFPVTQYFIQNIESPVKYHPGAVLSTSAAVSEGLAGMSVSMAATDIAIVGVSGTHQAIFLMDQMADADNTWVRKWYDAENDIQVYDINSGAHIGSMVLDMGTIALMGKTIPVRLNSAKFDLPLTCNFKIHLLSGSMDFKQNTSLLPGAEVEVDKEATVSVSKDNADPEHTGALYVYDAKEWDKYAYCNEYDGLNMVKGTAYTKVVRYAPSWNERPTKRDEQTCPPDAAINVHGTFQTATGFVYTSESGANIFSNNEDAGTFIFNESAEDAGERTVNNVKGSGTFEPLTFYPAKLKNGVADPAYANTADAEAGKAYCYTNDKWNTMSVADDPCFMVDDYDTYYAKPKEYVALANGRTENADHTYSDADGAGRLFILMDGCQWWEVEKKDNLYHCTHPDNDTYYYWDEDSGAWAEKRFTITWKNWDGTEIKSYDYSDPENPSEIEYNVTYGTMAEFLGTNPTREPSIDYTYNFTGWSPALGKVTSDVTYTATYKTQPRMYTITFRQEGGALIESQFLTHNEMPACENTPTKIGYTLEWSPAIKAVTGDATYTAVWHKYPPTKYEITFFDYNGTTELQKGDVNVGDMPTAPAIVDGKPQKEDESFGGKPASASGEFTYVFDHWSPAIETVSVDGPKSYTAIYREVDRKYTVVFQNEDGSEIESHDYAYGETPVCSETPTKPATAQYTYKFAWSPQIETVRGAAAYKATFTQETNKYTISLISNLNGVCTFTGAGTFDYGTTIDNIAVNYDDKKYKFDGWSDNEKTATHSSFKLAEDITLTANFTAISLEDKTVAVNETWNVPENTEVKDFVLTSTGDASGQLQNASNLKIRGEAIYRIEQSFAATTWYAVAVPWRVDIRTGVYAGSNRLKAGSQFFVIDFDANAYAGGSTNTMDYWTFLHQTTNVMVPGKLYMIYLTSDQSSLDFYKDKGASLITNKTSVSLTGGNGDRDNWNAIANPALFYANLNVTVENAEQDVQKYNGGDDRYELGSTSNMIVGEPMFVQVSAPSTVYATPTGGASPAPYRRALQETTANNRFVVELTQSGQLNDRMIVQTAEEKADEYVIGKDIAKMGISSSVAQMWMERYNTNLCKNTIEPIDERAEYPLSIFAPVAGEYNLSAVQQKGDASLYLTKNGEVIANLSDGAYTLALEKGTTTIYGLRISARAPQVATDLDAAIVDADGKTTKVLYHGQVFIIRDEKVYTVDGQLVK